MKSIDISPHARFKMKLVVVEHPQQTVPSQKRMEIRQSLIGRAGRMLLRVIIEEDADAIRVVTAYKTSKVAKYWRTT